MRFIVLVIAFLLLVARIERINGQCDIDVTSAVRPKDTNGEDCTVIKANVVIEDSSSQKLEKLDKISQITGDLILKGNKKLINYKGLKNLFSVGGNVLLEDNGSKVISHAISLPSLISVGKDLSFVNNLKTGKLFFPLLKRVEGVITIRNNAKLTTLEDSFEKLESTAGIEVELVNNKANALCIVSFWHDFVNVNLATEQVNIQNVDHYVEQCPDVVTAGPTVEPTTKPTAGPSEFPTSSPSRTPSAQPSTAPSEVEATEQPSYFPTNEPTKSKSTPSPSKSPVVAPTEAAPTRELQLVFPDKQFVNAIHNSASFMQSIHELIETTLSVKKSQVTGVKVSSGSVIVDATILNYNGDLNTDALLTDAFRIELLKDPQLQSVVGSSVGAAYTNQPGEGESSSKLWVALVVCLPLAALGALLYFKLERSKRLKEESAEFGYPQLPITVHDEVTMYLNEPGSRAALDEPRARLPNSPQNKR